MSPKHFLNRFTADRMVEQILSVYQAALSKPRVIRCLLAGISAALTAFVSLTPSYRHPDPH